MQFPTPNVCFIFFISTIININYLSFYSCHLICQQSFPGKVLGNQECFSVLVLKKKDIIKEKRVTVVIIIYFLKYKNKMQRSKWIHGFCYVTKCTAKKQEKSLFCFLICLPPCNLFYFLKNAALRISIPRKRRCCTEFRSVWFHISF